MEKRVYNGIITEDLTPIAFELAEEFQVETEALNLRDEIPTAVAIDLIQNRVTSLLVGVAKLEIQVGIATGRITAT